MNLDYTTLHFNSVISHFSDQFRNEEFLDCTLNAEGKSIKVHRAVLCAQSTLLEKMILEHIHVSDLFVTLDGVPFEDLKSVVQFMYDGWARLSKANFGSFLVVAQLLGMKWVDLVQINVEEMDAVADEASEPLQNITNVDLPQRKRKKCMKTKRHSKKLKCTRSERRLALRSPQNVVEETSQETDLAKMDENTFCTALGLKKITDEDVPPKLKLVSRTKRMPSLIKINCEEDKENGPPEHSVFIEEKNLSFLNADANEMRIRENNIEIECDVLEASSQYVVYEKANTEEIVELREGNSDSANHFHSDLRHLHHHHHHHHHHNGSISSSSSSSTAVVVDHLRNGVMATATDDVPTESSRKSSSSTSTSSRRSGSTAASKRRAGAAGGPKRLDGPAVFWCDVCQRTYHTKTGLNQHKRYECCKDPAFACPRCEKRFKRKSSLVRHAITLHDETIYPTRTKLLSKLTSLANRNILTIAGRRNT